MPNLFSAALKNKFQENKTMSLSKKIFLLAFIIAIGILLASVYFQFVKHLEPCSLCITQRILFLMIALTLLIALFCPATRLMHRIVSNSVLVFSVMGLYFAGRQIWLQHLSPDQLPDCGPSFNVLIENFPLSLVLKELLVGSAHCGVVTWEFLGLSMAHWSCILFAGFFGFAIFIKLKK